MRNRSGAVRLGLTLCALAACNAPAAPAPPLSRESSAQPSPQLPALQAAAPKQASAGNSGVDPRLPVVGDPLGLLSRPSTPDTARTQRAGEARPDPGALMASVTGSTGQPALERDARAVARGQSVESHAR
ncbi:MAG TPA: hypothetical protein VFZ61_01405, partial [Polyangiales bacterium]